MKKPLLAAALAVALVGTSGCAMFMRFVGDMTANAITQKTANLSEVAVRAFYTTNLFPKDSGMMETEIDTWQDGQNMLAVHLLKRSGVGMYELDGAVGYQAKPNGPIIPLTYVGKGAYQLALNAKDLGPKTIVLHTAAGQEARFQVAPAKPITIKAVNGKPAKGATIDLAKDLVLDLANPPGTAGSPVKVSIAAEAMGIRTMTAVGIFKAADRLTVPKEAFRNMILTASQDVGAVKIQKGPSYLVVERYAHALPASKAGAAETLGQAWSWAPVTVTGEAPLNIMLHAEGEANGASFHMFKGNAFYAPPLASAHQVAIGTLRARGKLYESYSYSSTSYGLGTVTTTTTTKTLKFPEVPDAYWNQMMATLEGRMAASFKRASGTTLYPPEKVAGSPTYKAMKEIAEQRDTREGGTATAYIVKIRPGSRYVIPEGLDGIEVSSTFPADRPMARLAREAGVDGVLSATLDLQIATQKDGKTLMLVPRLSYVIFGGSNSYAAGPVSYGQGFVELPEGLPFNAEALQSDPDELSRVVRIDDLMAGFEASLKAMRAKEQAAGYEAIWKGR